MKNLLAIPALLGVSAVVGLVAWSGLGSVAGALATAGWSGLAAIVVFHLVPLYLCAMAWRSQFRCAPADVTHYIWFRWIRDAGNELLGVLPVAGEMMGIRAMALSGVDGGLAAASTVVDMTLEMTGQVVFVVLGLTIALAHFPAIHVIYVALTGLGAMLALVVAFAAAQYIGFSGDLKRFARKLAAQSCRLPRSRMTRVEAAIKTLYGDHRRVLIALTIHIAAWIIGAGEAGIILYLLGTPRGIGALFVLESMTCAIRSGAFFVPLGLGVQEAGYALLASPLGLGPEAGLAISLLKRGRELIFGVLGLLLWQAIETGRLARRRRAMAADREGRLLATGLSTGLKPDQ